MDALLLLGIIPGTNIQISFDSWLRGTAVLLVLVTIFGIYRKRMMILIAVGKLVALVTRRLKLAVPTA